MPVALPSLSSSDRGGAVSRPPLAFRAKAWQIRTSPLLEPPIERLLRPEGRETAADEDDEADADRRAGSAQQARGRGAGERAAREPRSHHDALANRFLLRIVGDRDLENGDRGRHEEQSSREPRQARRGDEDARPR